MARFRTKFFRPTSPRHSAILKNNVEDKSAASLHMLGNIENTPAPNPFLFVFGRNRHNPGKLRSHRLHAKVIQCILLTVMLCLELNGKRRMETETNRTFKPKHAWHWERQEGYKHRQGDRRVERRQQATGMLGSLLLPLTDLQRLELFEGKGSEKAKNGNSTAKHERLPTQLESAGMRRDAIEAGNRWQANGLQGMICRIYVLPQTKRRIVPVIAGESGDKMAPLTPHSPSKD
eukprot:6213120-Pleurochrysis_carterae.AAC.7